MLRDHCNAINEWKSDEVHDDDKDKFLTLAL